MNIFLQYLIFYNLERHCYYNAGNIYNEIHRIFQQSKSF